MTDMMKLMDTFTVEGPLLSAQFDLFGLHVEIAESIVVQWLVMAILAVLFFVLGRNLKVEPTSKRQMAAEYLLGFFSGMLNDTIGEK